MSAVVNNQYIDVVLLGALGVRFGRQRRLCAKTVGQVMRLLFLNKEFKNHFYDEARLGRSFHVIVDDRARKEEELRLPVRKKIIISPAVEGEGGKLFGAIETVVGIALIVVAVFFPPAGFGAAAIGAIGSAGAALTLGGVTALLTSSTAVSTTGNSTLTSSYFNGASNTQTQGSPVPIVYGQMLIGSQVVSASLQAVDASQAGDVSGLIVD